MDEEKKAAPWGQEAESYRELLEQMKHTMPGREARILHKKLKKYGDGLFFRDRYPNFDLLVSVIALAVSVFTFILKCLGAGN